MNVLATAQHQHSSKADTDCCIVPDYRKYEVMSVGGRQISDKGCKTKGNMIQPLLLFLLRIYFIVHIRTFLWWVNCLILRV